MRKKLGNILLDIMTVWQQTFEYSGSLKKWLTTLLLFAQSILGITDCFTFNNMVVILIIPSCVYCIMATL